MTGHREGADSVRVVYLYGFALPGAGLPPGGLLGVGEAEIELIPEDGLTLVTARVPAERFSGPGLDRNLADVDWVAEQGLRHEQVIAWFVDHGGILPSRFLTLFSSRAALLEAVARDEVRIRGGLERFHGLREWDLKVGYDAARLEARLGEVSEEIRRLDRDIAGATPGRAFLLRKKRQDVARVEARQAAARLAGDLLTALARPATEAQRLALPVADTPVVLHAALLVPQEREDEALAVALDEKERLAGLGLDVQYTGPWAPYRFMEGESG